MNNNYLKCSIPIFLLLVSFNLYSQEQLSLAAAIKNGLSNNFQIRIADKNIEIAERNNNWLEAGALPSITTNASHNINWSESNNPTSFIQGKFTTNNTSYGADLNWVIFNGFNVHITKQKLAYLQEQSQGNAAVVVENTIQSIILGYYNALLQKEKLNALKNVIKISFDKYNKMSELKEMGSISTFDLLQVKNAYLTDSTNFLMQEIAYKNAMRNLNMLMADDVEKTYELTDQLSINELTYDLETLKDKLTANNQTLKNQYINESILKKDAKLAKSNMFPVISFGSGLSQSISGFKQGGFSTSGNSSFSYYANVTLSFTLFNGHKTHRAYQNLKIQEDIAQITTQEMELQLTNDLISKYELFVAHQSIVNLSKESLENAELNLNLAQEKYNLGSLSSFEFRDIQSAYLNASVQHLEATYNAISSHTDLVRLTGGIIEEFDNN